MRQLNDIMSKYRFLGMMVCLPAIPIGLAGCPAPTAEVKEHPVALLLASDVLSGVSSKQNTLDIDDVESVLVTVSEIILEIEEEEGGGSVTAFSGEHEVDLIDLSVVAELIDSPDVPEGYYSAVRLVLSNATLILADAPDVEIEDVFLPNGGVFEIPVEFSIDEEARGGLILDLGSIILLDLGDGTYELDFSLAVEVEVGPILVQALGRIKAVDGASFTLARNGSERSVKVANASIFRPGDFDAPSGSAEDLAVGSNVYVFGELGDDGSIEAFAVAVLRVPDTRGGHEDVPKREIEFGLASETSDASGKVEYREEPGRQRVKIVVKKVPSANQVFVVVDGDDFAVEMELDGRGNARLVLDTQAGNEVPLLTPESVIHVYNSATEELVLTSVLVSVEGGDDSEH